MRAFYEGDAKEVHAVLESTEEVHVAGLTYSEKAVQGWKATRAQDVILVAEVSGVIIGLIAARIGDPEADGAYIDCLIVKPEYRGRGIGQRLLERCISLLKERRVRFVHLHVTSDFPRAVHFWEKNGFRGKRNRYSGCTKRSSCSTVENAGHASIAEKAVC